MLGEDYKKYKEYQKKLRRLNYVLYILSFDSETDCPENGREYSLSVQQSFQEEILEIISSKDYKDLVKSLYENRNELDELKRLEIEEEYKEFLKIKNIPNDELIKHYEVLNKAGLLWKKGKDTNDFQDFMPKLKEIIDFNFKYIDYQEKPYDHPLDILLDENEDGFNVKKYDEFFDLIKKEIVPLAKKVIELPKKYNPKLDNLTFDIYKQKKITDIVCNMMGYTKAKGCVRETMHPFTNGFSSSDVRITTSYDEKLLFSNLFSVMHEAGHALYELGSDPKLDSTNLFGGTSMGIHESQSRFMENYLGRDYNFIKKIYPILKNEFKEELEDITVDDIYYYVNSVSNQLIRTEADELTYSIHILIRYEIEKMLFSRQISVKDIGPTFANLFEKYLGNRPKTLAEGAFQDVHWSSGFGYFPTYALGNAYAAQFYYKMKEELDLDKLLLEGNFKPINKWLDEKIHKYGKSRKNLWLVKNACGEDFNPNYYIKYLKEKYSKIYNL